MVLCKNDFYFVKISKYLNVECIVSIWFFYMIIKIYFFGIFNEKVK